MKLPAKMNKRKRYFVSIIWVYFKHFHDFSPEENYHLHALKIAKGLGYYPVAIVRDSAENMLNDPNFDNGIKVIEYKNVLKYLLDVIKYSIKGSVFYVNSYEWQSFLVPFISRKAIFMAHTQPQRRSLLKQKIQDFVYKFFYRIRLNNETEKEFLLERKISKKKLYVVPLVVSQNYFYKDSGSKRDNIMYFGNVTEKKNLPTILEAISIIKKIRSEIKLNIIGKIMDPSLNKTIVELDIEKNVELHGRIKLEELAKNSMKTLYT